MVILNPESLEKSAAELARGLRKEIPLEEAYRRALEIAPDNAAAHLTMGMEQFNAGEAEAARRTMWLALRAAPDRCMSYLMLSMAEDGAGDADLANSLTRFGLRVAVASTAVPETVQDLMKELLPALAEVDVDLGNPEVVAVFYENLQEHKPIDEPLRVTELLRPYRMLVELGEDPRDEVAEHLVAEFRAKAGVMTPLLMATLRNRLSFEPITHPWVPCRVVALVGEIGGPEVLPDLITIAGQDDDLNLSEHAEWALWRMGQRHPEATAAALTAAIDTVDEFQRVCLADHLWLLPPATDVTAGAARLIERLTGDVNGDDNPYLLAALRRALEEHPAPGGESLLARITLLSTELTGEDEDWFNEVLAGPPQLIDNGIELCAIERVLEDSLYDDDLEEGDSDDDTEGPFEFDEDEFARPLPVVAAAPKLGRNDSCWCGSGKKYKKCHLDEDEQRARQGYSTTGLLREPAAPKPPHLRLRDQMLDEMVASGGKRFLKTAAETYVGGSLEGLEMSDTDESCFTDWMLFDYRPKSKTLCEEYRDRHRGRLTTRELSQLDSWIQARYAMFEVQQVEPGRGVHHKNLATGEEQFVHDVTSSRHLVKWDVILQRVELTEGKRMFVGHGHTVPRDLLPHTWDWIDEQRALTKQSRAEMIAASSHSLHRIVKEMHEERWKNTKLVNFDGDPLEMGDATYKLQDREKALAALRGQADVDEADQDGEKVFHRLQKNQRDGSNTSIANIRLEAGSLVLHCNSRKRLKANRQWLEQLAGDAVKHQGDKFQSMDLAKQQALQNRQPPPMAQPPVPAGLVQQLKDLHYANWVNTPLPALSGETPVQAAQSTAGREVLRQLLRGMENSEERQRRDTGAGFDFARIRAQLKLDD